MYRGTSRAPRVAVIGATFTGNKGAASMLWSLLGNLPELTPGVEFKVLSVFPDADRKVCSLPGVEIIDATPRLLLEAQAGAMLAKALRKTGIPNGYLLKHPVLNALSQSDLLVDLSGLSFVDGRNIELIYNLVCIWPAMLMGKPVLKYSQAMGPFEKKMNRMAARWMLPKVDKIVARGRLTLGLLEELGVGGLTLGADAAFCMPEQVPIDEQRRLDDFYLRPEAPVLGVSASSVTDKYCTKLGTPYKDALAGLIFKARQEGMEVWILAHSVSTDPTSSRTDDVAVCEAIHQLLPRDRGVRLITEDWSPAALRELIGRCDLFIASRFHAMVSALVRNIPTLTIGWSHKYREVLSEFDMERWLIAHEQISAQSLWQTLCELRDNSDQARDAMAMALPMVRTSSQINAQIAAKMLEESVQNG